MSQILKTLTNKYKQEDNFKKQILSGIFLKDIFDAIESAKEIRGNNEKIKIHKKI
jgi:hypothetical protein